MSLVHWILNFIGRKKGYSKHFETSASTIGSRSDNPQLSFCNLHMLLNVNPEILHHIIQKSSKIVIISSNLIAKMPKAWPLG
jgi:hypothetical protein